MGNQIRCHLLQAWFGTHQCFRCCPPALGPLSRRNVVFIGEEVIHLLIHLGQQRLVERQCCQA
jgi:hypothetical protein